jgi:hypothetical protein
MAVEMMNGTRKGRLYFAGGMFMTFDGEASYRPIDTETDRLGLSFAHHSSDGTRKYLSLPALSDPSLAPDPHTRAEWNDNALGLAYVHRFDNGAKLQAGTSCGYTTFNYFGNPFFHTSSTSSVPPPDAAPSADVGIPSHPLSDANAPSDVASPPGTRLPAARLFQAHVGLSSPPDADGLRYRLNLDGRNFSHKNAVGNADAIAEHAMALDFDLNAPLSSLPDHRLGMSGTLQAHFGDAFEAVLSPYYDMKGENWQAAVGARFAILTGEKKAVFASPNIAASLKIARKTVVYAEARGDLRTNTWYELSRINPYAAPVDSGQRRLSPSRQWLDGQIGLRTGALNGAWFDIFLGYTATDDDYLILPDTAFRPLATFRSLTVEEGVDTRQLFVGLSCRYTHDDWLEASLRAVCSRWSRAGGDAAAVYERPVAEVDAGIRLFPTEMLTLSLDYRLAAGRKSLLRGEPYRLKNINALNLAATFSLTQDLCLHLRLDNLLFQRYELYCGYPLQGFHAQAGLSFIF